MCLPGFFGFIMIAIIIIQFFSIILDFILPLDELRLRKPLIPVECFILQDNYFYTIVLHELIIVFLYLSILLATATQLLLLACHSFGMFKIAR